MRPTHYAIYKASSISLEGGERISEISHYVVHAGIKHNFAEAYSQAIINGYPRDYVKIAAGPLPKELANSITLERSEENPHEAPIMAFYQLIKAGNKAKVAIKEVIGSADDGLRQKFFEFFEDAIKADLRKRGLKLEQASGE
jgi:hypothetical protein